jgi:DNA-binding SARP family transcriptional activator
LLDRPAARPRAPTSSTGAVPTLGLISGFELRQNGDVLAVPGSAQRLVAFLALHPRPLLRVFVAGTLWLESDEDHANASLRSALWRLQRLRCLLVTATPSHVGLAPDIRVDVRSTSKLAQDLIGCRRLPTKAEVELLCAAGDLLPDWYDEWLVIERERFRQLRLHALDAICRQLRGARRYSEAAEVGLAAVAAEPLRESAHRALIEVHLAEGNISEAIRQYETYRQLVAVHLGAEPSSELQRWHAHVSTSR